MKGHLNVLYCVQHADVSAETGCSRGHNYKVRAKKRTGAIVAHLRGVSNRPAG